MSLNEMKILIQIKVPTTWEIPLLKWCDTAFQASHGKVSFPGFHTRDTVWILDFWNGSFSSLKSWKRFWKIVIIEIEIPDFE